MTSYLSHDFFSFQLKNDGYQRYRRRTSMIFILNAIAFIYISLKPVSSFQRILLISIAAMLMVYSLHCLFGRSAKKLEYIVVYLLPALLWITELHFWPVGVILVNLLILHVLVETDTVVMVSEKELLIKNYRQKLVNWADLENVVLKDGLLSLDFRNNKIYQVEIDFTKAFIVHATGSGSLNTTELLAGEYYPDLERSFNNFAKHKLDENK